MVKVYILLADGFEEVEALTPADVLRRAGFEVFLVSTTGAPVITGSHDISVKTDVFLNDVDSGTGTILILPGGLPGTTNLFGNEKVKSLIQKFYDNGKWLAAICAAPMILGEMKLLEGKKSTCYPGFEKHLHGAELTNEQAVTDGKIVTGRGIGAAMAFSLEIVKNLSTDESLASELAKKMVVS
ncbi:DJ-1 family glyoxalase III [Alkalitalea saponilacus]|uniref:4-methyl-5(B-hydroxyethyl)-thiazole monophosphate biosynthesis n=1 Tax=Alkalitalea saponilacus TaxID=889453 RepID=A0A1T5HU86_9BACT|nr:DJ-1 family glyoxalase III [Alkalitalea saponilacus]ASB51177.1 DJ-1 family protein [Alkalitalea saponilacus]SKC24111.1 4-methyl-5(b-hydroxyethyl)-thiazole monophosphate biosynthesis [Alkalitalea saponilacus]